MKQIENIDGAKPSTELPGHAENPPPASTIKRRDLLKLGGSGAAIAGLALTPTGNAQPQPDASGESNTKTNLKKSSAFPTLEITQSNRLQTGSTLTFNYPDANSPCLLLKLGKPVAGGVGPGKDIVAYSILCSHRGCPVNFDTLSGTFKCPCHFSIFDPEKQGQQVCGQATTNLPRILLDHDDAGRITAVAIEGLIYGRITNLLEEA